MDLAIESCDGECATANYLEGNLLSGDEVLSAVLGGPRFWVIGTMDDKAGLHDAFAGTLVVFTNPSF